MDDLELLQQLQAGDEKAFRELVTRYHATVVRVARFYVRSEASADDVAQETWIAVMRGVNRFEGRSSLKTWLLQIVANRARTVAQRENRTITLDLQRDEPSVDPRRFDGSGLWSDPPLPFTEQVDDAMTNAPLVSLVRAAISQLPEPHQTVVTLRDVEGLTTAEVSEILKVTEGNVRVILHRGRARVRNAVELDLRGGAK